MNDPWDEQIEEMKMVTLGILVGLVWTAMIVTGFKLISDLL